MSNPYWSLSHLLMNVKSAPDDIRPSCLSGPNFTFILNWGLKISNDGAIASSYSGPLRLLSDSLLNPTLSPTIARSRPRRVVDVLGFVDCLDSICIKGCRSDGKPSLLSIRTKNPHLTLPHSVRKFPTTYPHQCLQLERPMLVC